MYFESARQQHSDDGTNKVCTKYMIIHIVWAIYLILHNALYRPQSLFFTIFLLYRSADQIAVWILFSLNRHYGRSTSRIGGGRDFCYRRNRHQWSLFGRHQDKLYCSSVRVSICLRHLFGHSIIFVLLRATGSAFIHEISLPNMKQKCEVHIWNEKLAPWVGRNSAWLTPYSDPAPFKTPNHQFSA